MSLAVRGHLRRPGFALDVDFASEARVTVLTGPSGAGKTLTLHMVAGLVAAEGVQVLLDGRDLAPLPVERRGLAMAFQEPRLYPHLGVRRNILQSRGDPSGLPALARALDIEALLPRRPADLSGGQAQRVSLARALLPDAPLTLLDEPFTGLDAARRAAVVALLRARTGRVLMVSHDPADAAALDAHVVRVEGGRAR